MFYELMYIATQIGVASENLIESCFCLGMHYRMIHFLIDRKLSNFDKIICFLEVFVFRVYYTQNETKRVVFSSIN